MKLQTMAILTLGSLILLNGSSCHPRPTPDQAEDIPAESITTPLPVPQVVNLPPEPNYYKLPTHPQAEDTPLRLEKVSETPNTTTDDETWWSQNTLDPIVYTVPNPSSGETGNLPDFIPPTFQDLILVKAIRTDPIVTIYGQDFSDGRYVVLWDPVNQQQLEAFDFSNYRQPYSYQPGEQDFVQMSINWAQLEDRILYFSYGHKTYAASSNGSNAYLGALDVNTSQILWRSDPLVSNSFNFILRDDAIITGYGFTAEPDYLYILNRGDGRIVERILIGTAANYLVTQGDKLFVRAYSSDYQYLFK